MDYTSLPPVQTLIFTNSYDGTTDILLKRSAPSDAYFRFNLDQFDEYEVSITPEGFSLKDPVGRVATDRNVAKGYYRKPRYAGQSGDPVTDFLELEKWTAFRSIVCCLAANGKLVLVDPFCEKTRCNKIRQLSVARKYFNIAQTVFSNALNDLAVPKNLIAKSLNSGSIGAKTLYSTKVLKDELVSNQPWYLQEFVRASHDLTVVHVNGRNFGFSLDRALLEDGTVDCRQSLTLWDHWKIQTLDAGFEANVNCLMRDLKLLFGRLDFLVTSQGLKYFCEVNPNGQFAWLDLIDATGMLASILMEISPRTPATAKIDL